MTVSYAKPSKGLKIKHIKLRFPVLPYMYCDFFGIFSQYYVWYLVKDVNSFQFALRNVIFDLFDTSLVKFGTKEWAMIQLCLKKLRCYFYTQNMIPWPITNSPTYCELFQNSLMWIFYNLFTFILPLSQLFWNVLQLSNTTFALTFTIHLLYNTVQYIYVGKWKPWKSK